MSVLGPTSWGAMGRRRSAGFFRRLASDGLRSLRSVADAMNECGLTPGDAASVVRSAVGTSREAGHGPRSGPRARTRQEWWAVAEARRATVPAALLTDMR